MSSINNKSARQFPPVINRYKARALSQQEIEDIERFVSEAFHKCKAWGIRMRCAPDMRKKYSWEVIQ